MKPIRDSPILVTGAAGAVGAIGRSLTAMLLAKGHKVRALVRREDERAGALRGLGARTTSSSPARRRLACSTSCNCTLLNSREVKPRRDPFSWGAPMKVNTSSPDCTRAASVSTAGVPSLSIRKGVGS